MTGGPVNLTSGSGITHQGGTVDTTGTTNQTGTQNVAQTGTQTGTTTSGFEGPSWATPLLNQIAGQIGTGVGGAGAINPFTQQGLSGAAQYASGQAPMLANNLAALNRIASGADVTGGSAAFQQMQQRGASDIANRINQAASGAGRYGSASQAGALGRNLSDYYARTNEGELAREQGLQLQAAGMVPGAFAAGLSPYQTLQQTGQTAQGLPAQQLGQYANLLATLNPAAYGTRTGTTTGATTGATAGTTTGQTLTDQQVANNLTTINNQLGNSQQQNSLGGLLGSLAPLAFMGGGSSGFGGSLAGTLLSGLGKALPFL